jgi:hypothetical protein
MYPLKKLTLALMIMCSVLKSRSQSVTSPYSIGGVGDIENRNIGRSAGMASVSAAMRYNLNINVFNPASLTAMPTHLFLFDVGAKGRSSRFTQPGIDTTSTASSDFAVKRVSLAYKATKKMAFSIGLQPFSSTNYNFNSVVPLPGGGSASYLRTVEGTGSLQQLYFGQALELGSHFSVGYTFSYLFGSQIQNINYYDGSALNVTKVNTAYYRNPYFKVGLQYYSKPEKKVQHRFGAFASMPVTLKGNSTYSVTDGSTIVQDSIVINNTPFKVPLMVTAGYSVTFNHKLTFSADYNFNQWQKQTTPVAGLTLAPSNRVSLGVEKENLLIKNNQYKPYYLQGGLFYENTYWKVNGNYVTDFGFTIGAGTNIGRSFDGSGINVFGALEVGKRGNSGKGQIGDFYQQFTIGVSFFNIWQKSIYQRYN